MCVLTPASICSLCLHVIYTFCLCLGSLFYLSLSSPLPGGCDRYPIQAGGKRERGEGRWRRRKRSISIPHRWGRALKKTQKERKKTGGNGTFFGVGLLRKKPSPVLRKYAGSVIFIFPRLIYSIPSLFSFSGKRIRQTCFADRRGEKGYLVAARRLGFPPAAATDASIFVRGKV